MPNAKPVGRPPNPSDPIDAHKAEILEWVKVNKRARQLIGKQLLFFEKQLENAGTGGATISMEGMLQVMAGLGQLVGTGNRVIEQGLKSLDRGGPNRGDMEDPNEIMASLEGGRG